MKYEDQTPQDYNEQSLRDLSPKDRKFIEEMKKRKGMLEWLREN